MFLKKADSDSAAVHEWKKLFRLSIKKRLTFLYFLSAFTMMTAVTVFQDWVLVRGLERDEVQLVSDKVRSLESTLRLRGDDLAFLEHEVKSGSEYRKDLLFYSFHSRVLDDDDRVLISTRNMDSVLPISVFPSPLKPEEVSTSNLMPHWTAVNGRSYFLVSVWTRSGGDNGPRRVIQVALDDTGEHSLIASYRRDALLALAFGTILFAGISALIARAGLRPVDKMALIAEQITASELKKPMGLDPTESWPDELKTLAKALSRMLSRLDESFDRCSKCTEDLAHELRTPINNLMVGVEVALSRKRSPQEYQQVLSSNLEEYARLTRFINEMLLLARADNPQTEIRRIRFNVHHELENLLDFHDAQAQEQGITMVCEGEASVYADPLLFRHAVSNLISNALDHTPAEGQISLEVRSLDGDGEVEITVQDSGCGIPAEELPEIGERYHHVKKAKADRNGGTGLGLAIVKSIMQLHGGSLEIYSQVGKGSQFRLRFPMDIDRVSADLDQKVSLAM